MRAVARITAVQKEMADTRESVSGRRSSGLLQNASPAQGGETGALDEALRHFTLLTRAITVNVRNVNANLERILTDKSDIEELARMLNSLRAEEK